MNFVCPWRGHEFIEVITWDSLAGKRGEWKARPPSRESFISLTVCPCGAIWAKLREEPEYREATEADVALLDSDSRAALIRLMRRDVTMKEAI